MCVDKTAIDQLLLDEAGASKLKYSSAADYKKDDTQVWRDYWIWGWFRSPQPQRGPSKFNKEENDALVKKIQKVQPEKKQNILVLGQVGVGKTSFINSVISIDKERKYGMTMSGDLAEGSCTDELEEYSSEKLLKGYRLFDWMGFEVGDEKGCFVEDFMFLIKGHIKTGYKFKTNKPINENDKSFRRNPTFEDQMHSVIFVVTASSVDAGLQQEYKQTVKELQLKLRQENIPKVMILTKVDTICEEVAKDETKMFKSAKVLNIIKEASESFGIDEASIHPVVNYVGHDNILPVKNIPLLLALRQAMNFSQDRVDYVEHRKK